MSVPAPMQLQGRHILVTGAAGGIGQEMCRLLVTRGARVACLDRDEDRLGQLTGTNPDSLLPVVTDLTDVDACAEKIAGHQREHGRIDSLVNNAAFIYNIGTLQKTSAKTWADEIEANLNGPFNITHILLEQFAKSGGVIVTIASVNALTTLGHPAYSAAKAGLVSFAQAVAMEYGRFGVRSNVILPGTVATPAWQQRIDKDPQIFAKLAKWYPLGKVVTPQDVAKAACFLLSDDASAISGATLNVDCGLMSGILPFANQLVLEDLS